MANTKKNPDSVVKNWFQVLTAGMKQGTDTTLSQGGALLQNVTTDEVGNYATRPGMTVMGSSLSTNPGYGLWDYNPTDGTHKLFAVADRDLFLYNESTGSWGSAVDTNEWASDVRVHGVDFLNRSYIGSDAGTDPLCYTTGGAVTDIVPTIGGGIMAVNKDILAVGGNSIKPSIIFFTDPFTDTFHAATGTCAANADVGGTGYLDVTTAIFTADIERAIAYNSTDGTMVMITDWVSSTRVKTDGTTSTWDNDTVYVMVNVAKHDNKVTAMEGYQDNFVSFDTHKMYVWDPISGWSSKYLGYGCVNDSVLKTVGGWLVWVGYDGIYRWNGTGLPEDISKDIKNNVTGYGVWNLIDKSALLSLSAGVLENRYYLSVGTLSTLSGAPCSAKANVVLVYDLPNESWTLRTYPDQITLFTNFIDNTNQKGLYGIGKNDAYVFRLDYGTIDKDSTNADVAISTDIMLPHHQLYEDPTVTAKVKEYYTKYSCDAAVTVKASADRGTYKSLATLPITSGTKTYAMNPTTNAEGMTHSLEFSTTGKLILEGYGFLTDIETTTRLPRK